MKSILITGASTGIGLDAAEYLASKDWKVYAGVRKAEDKKRLDELHPNIESVIFDISHNEHIDNFIQNVDSLDVLFNNAGIALGGPVELLPIDDIKRQFDINVISHISVTQKIIPLLRKSKDPRILFTSSQSGYFTKPFTAVYSASKFAIEALADAMRIELSLGEPQIKVSLIEPGVIKTPIWDKSVGKAITLEKEYDEKRKKDYQYYIDKIAEITKEYAKTGTEVREVSKVVFKAVSAKNPCARYRVGRDAKTYYFLSKFLPYSLRDKLIRNYLRKI